MVVCRQLNCAATAGAAGAAPARTSSASYSRWISTWRGVSLSFRNKKEAHCSTRCRWHTDLGPWKAIYWQRERSRERTLMAHERHEDCQDRHPRSVLWDAL